jgi:hypothetical protein
MVSSPHESSDKVARAMKSRSMKSSALGFHFLLQATFRNVLIPRTFHKGPFMKHGGVGRDCFQCLKITVACLIVRIADIPFLAVSVKEYGIQAFTGRKDQVKNYETIEFQLLSSHI